MTPWVGRLLFANGLMFLASYAFPSLSERLVLVPALAFRQPWTPLTYMFLHAGLWHLLFNMLGLYFFGPRLEVRLGSRRFVWLYLSSGLGGAALSFVFTPGVAIVGASGAIFGIFLGYARFWPRDLIYIWGIVPVQARVLVFVMTALSLGFGLAPARDNIAHFAHLGGFLAAWVYLKWIEVRAPARRFRRRAQPDVGRRPTGDLTRVAAWERIPRDDLHQVNREEVDRLLEKLRTRGVTSLTPDERAFLDRFAAD